MCLCLVFFNGVTYTCLVYRCHGMCAAICKWLACLTSAICFTSSCLFLLEKVWVANVEKAHLLASLNQRQAEELLSLVLCGLLQYT